MLGARLLDQLDQLNSTRILYDLSPLALCPQPLLCTLLLIHLILPRQRELANETDGKNSREGDTGAVEEEDGAKAFRVAFESASKVSGEVRGWQENAHQPERALELRRRGLSNDKWRRGRPRCRQQHR